MVNDTKGVISHKRIFRHFQLSEQHYCKPLTLCSTTLLGIYQDCVNTTETNYAPQLGSYLRGYGVGYEVLGI